MVPQRINVFLNIAHLKMFLSLHCHTFIFFSKLYHHTLNAKRLRKYIDQEEIFENLFLT